MKAITVEPKKSGSAQLENVSEPDLRSGSVLVEAIAVGVCGTDVEITEGKYGWAPTGESRLILGHESLGRVLDPGSSSSLKKGVPIPSRVRTVPWVSGTCAATVSTPRGASNRSMATCPNAGELNPSTPSRLILRSGCSVCCWSPQLLLRKRGSTR
jgi:D-arabinose 1-dehydrogenase-like Zn-dependent alcohol dehydrogenase